MRIGSATYIVSSSAQIDPGAIVDSDINAAAAIASTKLNMSAMTQDLLLSVTKSNDLGSVAKQWNNLYTYILNTTYVKDGLTPWADGTQPIGDITHTWADIFVNEIKGNAAGQIMVNGLLGEIV